jgi:hypothetical protein
MPATTPGQTPPSPAEVTGAKVGMPMPIISSHHHPKYERPIEVANGRTPLPIGDLRRVDSSSSSHGGAALPTGLGTSPSGWRVRTRTAISAYANTPIPVMAGSFVHVAASIPAVWGDAMPFARDARDRRRKSATTLSSSRTWTVRA